tara:strand:- start:44 stop:1159 length:1116 start_codon:yes stop_codon:yes gene_type:complete
MKFPRIILIIDGMGDHPSRELVNKTPLQAANSPVLDKLAQEGKCGSAHPMGPGEIANTVSGTLSILGFNPKNNSISRGVVESIGCNSGIIPGDIAFRGNWGTIDSKGFILDRRAARIREGTEKLCSSLNGLKIENIEFLVSPATEHRVSIVLREKGISEQLSGSDPFKTFNTKIKPLIPKPFKRSDKKSLYTAKILNLFELKARNILKNHPINLYRQSKNLLPANIILSRESGAIDDFPKLKDPSGSILKGIFITEDDTISGISKMIGLKICKTSNMTANLDTDINEKFKLAKKFLNNQELVILHIKGCDIAAHNKDPKNKKIFLEKIDSELGKFLEKFNSKFKLAITADHSTSSINGLHIEDPVPLLLNG